VHLTTVAAANIFRSVRQRNTIFVQSLLHRTESITVSRLVRKCAPAVYRTWLKCMAGIYPVQAYLSRIGLVKSSACPHCGGAQPETLTHFACVCPAFREARTSAHNQVRQEITSYLASLARPRWIIFEETRMGATGLQLRPVSASQVVNARPDCEPVADSHGRCHLTRWQPDWLLVSSELKKIAIVDLCRPSDVHHDQLIEAATRKQHSYSPLVEALDHYSNQGWIVHVFPWVVGIRGMIDPVPIQALLEFLDVPRSQRQLAVDRTVLASVRALHFLHQVRFGGRPARAGGALNLDSNDSGDEANETVALPRVRKRKRVCTPGNASVGVGYPPPAECLTIAHQHRQDRWPFCLRPIPPTKRARAITHEVRESNVQETSSLVPRSATPGEWGGKWEARDGVTISTRKRSLLAGDEHNVTFQVVHVTDVGEQHNDSSRLQGRRKRLRRLATNSVFDAEDQDERRVSFSETGERLDELWTRWRRLDARRK